MSLISSGLLCEGRKIDFFFHCTENKYIEIHENDNEAHGEMFENEHCIFTRNQQLV